MIFNHQTNHEFEEMDKKIKTIDHRILQGYDK